MNQFLSFLARVNEEADLAEMARGILPYFMN